MIKLITKIIDLITLIFTFWKDRKNKDDVKTTGINSLNDLNLTTDDFTNLWLLANDNKNKLIRLRLNKKQKKANKGKIVNWEKQDGKSTIILLQIFMAMIKEVNNGKKFGLILDSVSRFQKVATFLKEIQSANNNLRNNFSLLKIETNKTITCDINNTKLYITSKRKKDDDFKALDLNFLFEDINEI